MSKTWAFGLSLQLVATADGGRQSPIITTRDVRMGYRPNWGLPSMEPPEQTGAPVFAFERLEVVPGSVSVRAVIIVLYPQTVARWEAEVFPGAKLPMYEGSRVVGVGAVLWRRPAHMIPTPVETAAYEAWLSGALITLGDD